MIKLASCRLRASPLRAAVDLRAVADVEDVDHAAVLVEPVDAAIGTPPGAVASGQRPEQRFADLEPGTVEKLLCEIDADPTCIFWG